MKAIDRVMQAYSSTRKLTAAQAEFAREQLSKFIDELMSGKVPRAPTNDRT